MPRWFVSIAQFTEKQMAFFGYQAVDQNEEFIVYRHVYTNEDHVVRKADPYLYVDDINDSIAMSSSKVVDFGDD